MAYATVSFLVEYISQLLNSKNDQISGAEAELQLLKNEFDSLRSVLGHAANKVKKKEPLMMEKEIKDVVYEAEESIDSCLTMAAAIGNKKWWHRRGLNAKPVNLAEEVRLIRENKVKPIVDRYEGIKPLLDLYDANVQDDVVESGGSSGLVQTRTRLEKLRVAHHFVGVVDDQEFLIESLMEHTVELDVISIVGMGGSGRTTLARKIFNNPAIRNEFTTRIWVNISFDDNFKRKDMCVSILKQLTTRDMSRLSEFELAQKVCALLEEEKFLLVFTDVWSVEQLDVIREVLPKSNGTRKVLITSRRKSVGDYANQRRVPHTLRLLSRQESWELLQLQVFGNLLDCPPQLEQIGKSIADACIGLPFTITLVGGSIAARLSTTSESITTVEHTWNEISESLQTYLGNGYDYTSDIMNFSYGELPDDLKYCFLYFGLFPEEYDISVWTLTRLWIAEGFIQCKDGWSLEETAENHLTQLINRNLVMVCKTNSIGTVKTCRVHKYVRDFCTSKVAFTEQNLFQEINMSNDEIFDSPGSSLMKFRRVCIHSHLSEFLSKNLNGAPQLRSILCVYEELLVLFPEYISAIPDAFKLLRVMESKCIKFTKFPMKFTRLIHLRYFTLSCDDLDVLPETLSQLRNLQTLVVETESPFLEVRANIWIMIQLRHFITQAAITLAQQGEHNDNAIENLQTLTRLSPESCTEEVLNRVPNLKTLGIRGQLTTLVLTECLTKMHRLEKLKLVNDLFYEPTSTNYLHRFLSPNSLPPNLKRLSLSATSLDWEHMSVLGMISTLEVLKLKNNAFRGSSWSLDGHTFPRLESLLIADTDIVHWEMSTDCFPSLRCLVIKNCEELRGIPLDLAKSLETLDIERLNRYAVASAKKIEELKELMQVQQTTERMVRFKLTIGDGCEGSQIDHLWL